MYIIQRIKEFFGYPTPPQPHQIGEKLVTMRQPRDCHTPMAATLCGVTYEQAHKALWHFNLPFFIESPLLSNPLNVKRGIKKLGFEPVEIGLTPLLEGNATPGKVGVLVHDRRNPWLFQHWVCWFGKDAVGNHLLHWGVCQELVPVPQKEFVEMVLYGFPNCVFEVRQ